MTIRIWILAASINGFLAIAAWLFIAGTVLFSGSLYLLALTGVGALAWLTPFGGVAFLLGWLSLGIFAWRYRRHVP